MAEKNTISYLEGLLTVNEMCKALDVTKSNISKWRTNGKILNNHQLIKISAYLKSRLSDNDLLRHKEEYFEDYLTKKIEKDRRNES